MSQFRDTFTKDSNKEPLLSYDDSAFVFFAGTILICVLLPCTYIYIKSLINRTFKNGYYKLRKSKHNSVYRSCDCSLCISKRDEKDKHTTLLQKIGLKKIFEFFLLVVLWGVLIVLINKMLNIKPMQTFDPFEILEVAIGATESQVKKAYRLKSLKYHPDKNPNDPSAAAKFILITKAYQALTDESSKENYEKYGNPDGPGMMKVGIGLPKILIDERYQLLILSIFFLIFLVFIPFIFMMYYQKQKRYGPNGVKIETLQYLNFMMNEGSRLKVFPELLAWSAESRDLLVREEDEKIMRNIMDEVVVHKKKNFDSPIITRNMYLILAHMQRKHHLLTKELKEDLEKILRFSMLVTHSMIEISILRDWFLTAQSALNFRRCLIQAFNGKNSHLLQIPHFGEELTKHFSKGKPIIKDLVDFLHMLNKDQVPDKRLSELSAEQLLDVRSFCKMVPTIEVSAEILVEDETHIVKGDIASIYVRINRLNLEENEAAGFVHSPFFPQSKLEEWWIIATYRDEERILKHVHVKNCEKHIEERLQYMVDRTGHLCISIYLFNDSYFGCDKKIDVPFRAYSTAEIKREIFVHPEDIELDNEPTLFQQMLGDLKKNESSEEEIPMSGDKNTSSLNKKKNLKEMHENYEPEEDFNNDMD